MELDVLERRFLAYCPKSLRETYANIKPLSDIEDLLRALESALFNGDKYYYIGPVEKWVLTMDNTIEVGGVPYSDIVADYTSNAVDYSSEKRIRSAYDAVRAVYDKLLQEGVIAVADFDLEALESCENTVLPMCDSHLAACYRGLKASGTWSYSELAYLLMRIKEEGENDLADVKLSMDELIKSLAAKKNQEGQDMANKNKVENTAVESAEIEDKVVEDAMKRQHNKLSVGVITDDAETTEVDDKSTDAAIVTTSDDAEITAAGDKSTDAAIVKTSEDAAIIVEESVADFNETTGDSVDKTIEDLENTVDDEEDCEEFPSDEASVEESDEDVVDESGEDFPDEAALAEEREMNEIEKGNLIIDDGEDFPDETALAEEREMVEEERGNRIVEDGEDFPDEAALAEEREMTEIERGNLIAEDDSENEYDGEEDCIVDADIKAVGENSEADDNVVSEDDTENDFSGEEDCIVEADIPADEAEAPVVAEEDDGEEFPSADDQGIVDEEDTPDDEEGPELKDAADIRAVYNVPAAEDTTRESDYIENYQSFDADADDATMQQASEHAIADLDAIQYDEDESLGTSEELSAEDDPWKTAEDSSSFGGENPFSTVDDSWATAEDSRSFGGESPFSTDSDDFEEEKAQPPIQCEGNDISININTKLARGETIQISVTRKFDGTCSLS